MVESADIRDEESLKAWLEGQPRAVAVWIAARAAARVLPLWWQEVLKHDWAHEGDLTALPVLRSVLISSVAAVRPTKDIKATAADTADAARAAADAAVSALDAAADDDVHHVATARNAVLTATAAIGAVTASGDVATAHAAREAASWAVGATYGATASTHGLVLAGAAWDAFGQDVAKAAGGKLPDALPLWPGGAGPLAAQWAEIKAQVAGAPDAAGWQFWLDWYDALLKGRPMLGDAARTWEMLEKIALIDPETWDKGPEAVNPVIREIWEGYKGTPLSSAAIVDFDFNAALQQMDVVGFDDDVAHLKDPDAVAAFVDDIVELQDGLQDFLDFSEAERRTSNALPMLGRAAEKILDELRRTRDKTHIRARRLVTLGGYLYSFSLEEDKRDELGGTLANMLDRNVGLLQAVCRKHLAPSLARMEPLAGLDREARAPGDMLATMRKALDALRAADGTDMARLSPEGRAVLAEMVGELDELVAAADAAITPERRETLLARFTRGYGGVAATFGRFTEKARPHAAKASEAVDWLIRNFRRWKSMQDILDWLDKLGGGGPPPA